MSGFASATELCDFRTRSQKVGIAWFNWRCKDEVLKTSELLKQVLDCFVQQLCFRTIFLGNLEVEALDVVYEAAQMADLSRQIFSAGSAAVRLRVTGEELVLIRLAVFGMGNLHSG